ncbi:transcriptional regulator with XRE-family HTH domain [Bradyrhizobium japonicum]
MSSENNTLNIGPRIRRARLSKGLRMRDLAQVVGCDESMISKIEAGKVMPSLPMLAKMVDALDRDMASLVLWPADRRLQAGAEARGSAQGAC